MDIFSNYKLGNMEIANRIIMAPMTRSRALEGNVPNPLAATYYAQRASAGLIITEATQVSPQGVGYIRTPGIHSKEQIEGWRKITEAVHKAGGKIFLQLWHVGRISHPDFHGGELPVAPSAIAAQGEVYTQQGMKKMVTPRALKTEEINGIVQQFRQGAENAKAAGFDGVEIHGANGYLLDQFLRDGTNSRTDEYGGSVENRARFPLEVIKAVCDVWGANRVGYRISPTGTFNSMSDSNPKATFSYFVEELNKLKLCYLHVAEDRKPDAKGESLTKHLRSIYQGTYIANGGYDGEVANATITNGNADLVAFGALFLANPDLPARFRNKSQFNKIDTSTFYMGEERGYTDYPKLA